LYSIKFRNIISDYKYYLFDLLERTAFGVHSKSKEKIENWCENIRKLGIEIFDYDHQKSEFRRLK